MGYPVDPPGTPHRHLGRPTLPLLDTDPPLRILGAGQREVLGTVADGGAHLARDTDHRVAAAVGARIGAPVPDGATVRIYLDAWEGIVTANRVAIDRDPERFRAALEPKRRPLSPPAALDEDGPDGPRVGAVPDLVARSPGRNAAPEAEPQPGGPAQTCLRMFSK